MTPIRAQDVIVATATDVSRRSVVLGMGVGALAAAFAAAGWSVGARAQDATPVVMEPMEELNAAVFVYNHPDDSAAFQEYLHSTHLPLALAVPGIQSLIVHSSMVVPEFVPGDIYQIGTVIFASQADMEDSLASDEAAAAMADLGNFATGGFTAYLASVRTIEPPADPGATPPA